MPVSFTSYVRSSQARLPIDYRLLSPQCAIFNHPRTLGTPDMSDLLIVATPPPSMVVAEKFGTTVLTITESLPPSNATTSSKTASAVLSNSIFRLQQQVRAQILRYKPTRNQRADPMVKRVSSQSHVQ